MESRIGTREKVALITGGNAGIGLALAARLLQNASSLRVCLGCRNRARAEAARAALLAGSPAANVDILLIDVASPASVYKASIEIRGRYQHIDYLFLNAGIMPSTTVDWQNFLKQLFSSCCVHMFATGDGLLRQKDEQTSDGMKQIFATNLFGHFILVKELETLMGGTSPSQIVWTSSSNAKKEAFSLEDLQHANGTEPYSASKYGTDLVSYALNERLNAKRIYSHTTSPGLVMTNMTYGILPRWCWLILLPVLWLLRLFTTNITISPYNATEALFWLTRQRPETLDPMTKFHSHVSVTGHRYVAMSKMDINAAVAEETCHRLDQLEARFRSTCRIRT